VAYVGLWSQRRREIFGLHLAGLYVALVADMSGYHDVRPLVMGINPDALGLDIA
jgi:hypothetical protein